MEDEVVGEEEERRRRKDGKENRAPPEKCQTLGRPSNQCKEVSQPVSSFMIVIT